MGEPLFVSFEGIDGAGKTTQIGRLSEHLTSRGREVRVFREPGGTALGERVRELLLDGDEITPWAEASLFAAARAELVEREIRPALAAGSDVICDRYLDSSLAYQGLARGLGEDAVLAWNLHVTGGLLPDITFLLRVPVDDASARIADPATDAASRGGLDRLERESVAFRRRVASAFDELAERWPGRVVSLDGTLAPDALAAEVRTRVEARLASATRRAG